MLLRHKWLSLLLVMVATIALDAMRGVQPEGLVWYAFCVAEGYGYGALYTWFTRRYVR